MAQVLPLPRREFFVDTRGSAMSATWHDEDGMVVLSIWHGEICVGTVRLDAHDATRLAMHLVGHLGAHATGRQT